MANLQGSHDVEIGPPLLKVAKKYYMQRVYELRALMQLEEDKFRCVLL